MIYADNKLNFNSRPTYHFISTSLFSLFNLNREVKSLPDLNKKYRHVFATCGPKLQF